jgi:hypothetical protein
MAIAIPPHLNINPPGCRWDPIDAHLCFDADSCGCYMSPCDYFEVEDADCAWDTSELCCTLVETC